MAPGDHGTILMSCDRSPLCNSNQVHGWLLGSLFLVEGNHILIFFPSFSPSALVCLFSNILLSDRQNCRFRGWEDSRDTSLEQQLMGRPSETEQVTALPIYCLSGTFPSAFSQIYYFFCCVMSIFSSVNTHFLINH